MKTTNPIGYLKNGKYFSFEQMQGETNDNSDVIVPLYSTPIPQPHQEVKSIEECKDEVAKKYSIPTNEEFAKEHGIKEIQCSNWEQLIRYAKTFAHEEGLNKIINEAMQLYYEQGNHAQTLELPSDAKEQLIKLLYENAHIEQVVFGTKMERTFEKEANAIIEWFSKIPQSKQGERKEVEVALPSDEALRCEYSQLREKHGMNEAIPLFAEWLFSKIPQSNRVEKKEGERSLDSITEVEEIAIANICESFTATNILNALKNKTYYSLEIRKAIALEKYFKEQNISFDK